ncbi:MAG: ABC transporter substrate-binding protein [Proteobacteria bacterium]|nr:ABC transporter substrate-binding protein [Pseudomonadota bacterium]
MLSTLAGEGLDTRMTAFQRALDELGYRPGPNVVFEYRWAGYQLDRLPLMAAELVRLAPDVIVALEPPSALAAKNATAAIPIVIRVDDPVELGYIAGLARPGGNITGVASISSVLDGKRLELLKELIPGLISVAALWDPSYAPNAQRLAALAESARALGIETQAIPASAVEDIGRALARAREMGVAAVITMRNPLLVAARQEVAAFALRAGLPVIYDDRQFVEAGGLVSYGANLTELYRHAAAYVDKILRGAKPADLPVEQPTTFEMVINLKTAAALGLAIPPMLLARADEVVE